jgi:signal peptidase I
MERRISVVEPSDRIVSMMAAVWRLRSHVRILSVATGSMRPLIQQGDRIVVEGTDDFRCGDIVVYRQGRHFLAHRLVAVRTCPQQEAVEIITKGDWNAVIDRPIRADWLVGRVIGVVRGARHMSLQGIASRRMNVLLFLILRPTRGTRRWQCWTWHARRAGGRLVAAAMWIVCRQRCAVTDDRAFV